MRKSNFILGITLGLNVGCSGDIGPGGEGGGLVGSGAMGGDGATATGTTTGVPTGTVTGVATGNGSSGTGTAAGGGAGPTGDPGTGGNGVPGVIVADGEFPPAPMLLDGAPIYTRFMRLTNQQWERAVQDVLGLSAPPDQARFFQTPVPGQTDFVNNEALLTVTNDLWAQYHTATRDVVARLTASDAGIQALYAGTDAREFIATVGRRAFRRPLEPAEVDRLETVFNAGAALVGNGTASAFTTSAGLVLEAMLQSPHFLYRTELGTDGAPLSGYEMASKLSFFLRGTTPSDELLDAAERGELNDAAGAAQLATQMLAEPEAAATFTEFHHELFEFSRFQDIQRDVQEFDPEIDAELEESSVLFFNRIFNDDLGVRDILTSTEGYVGPLMAELYELPPTSSMSLQELGAERAGYFSQIPFLLLYGNNEHSDAIHRGVHVNFDVLCASIPPPPPNIDPLPPAASGETDRERVESGTAACGACHAAYINPVGFAFENFDGLGRLRTTDGGEDVNTTGSYPFTDGTKDFANAQELMTAMAASQMPHLCYANHLAGYALQRDMAAQDAGLIERLMTSSLSAQSSVKQLVLDLVADPSFATRNGGSL